MIAALLLKSTQGGYINAAALYRYDGFPKYQENIESEWEWGADTLNTSRIPSSRCHFLIPRIFSAIAFTGFYLRLFVCFFIYGSVVECIYVNTSTQALYVSALLRYLQCT